MNPNSLSHLSSLAKVAAFTFCGAVLAIVATAGPDVFTSWTLFKPILLAGLGAGVAAEVVFLRSQIATYLAGTVISLPEQVANDVAVVKVPKLPPLPCLALAMCLALMGCKSFGGDVTAATPAIGPTLQCVATAAMAVAAPSPLTLEDALASCGVAAADIDQAANAIETLAAAPVSASLLSPVAAKKIMAMKRRPATLGALYLGPAAQVPSVGNAIAYYTKDTVWVRSSACSAQGDFMRCGRLEASP